MGNDPVNFVDPSGLKADCVEATKRGAIAGAAAGTAVGIGASGVCDVGTVGGCAVANPAIVAGAAGLGGAAGGLLGNGLCHFGNWLEDLIMQSSSESADTRSDGIVVEGNRSRTKEQEEECDKKHKEYKKFCDEDMPKWPDELIEETPQNYCKYLKNAIAHMEKCIALVEAFDDLCAPGRHDDNRIKQGKKKLNKLKKKLRNMGGLCDE